MPAGNWSIAVSEQVSLNMEKSVLPRAIKGDYDSLCFLLLYISESIRKGIPLTPKLAEYLADALLKISRGGKRDNAFHIRRGRGERDTREAEFKNIDLACRVALVKQEWDYSKKKRLKGEDPIGQVASGEKVPYETVKAAWRDYRTCIELTNTPGVVFIFGGKPKKTKRRKAGK